MSVELKELVGEHELSGVDTGHVVVTEFGSDDNAKTITFILDGETYTATEDPADGYRSLLKALVKGGAVKNTFPPQRVICSYIDSGLDDDCDYVDSSDVLVMRDATTGLEVLAIGTDNNNDYYPYCVMRFDPSAMACNAEGKSAAHE